MQSSYRKCCASTEISEILLADHLHKVPVHVPTVLPINKSTATKTGPTDKSHDKSKCTCGYMRQ